MTDPKAEYMTESTELLPKCSRCCDTGMTEGFNSWTLGPCVIFCDCEKGSDKQGALRKESNTRPEPDASVGDLVGRIHAYFNAPEQAGRDVEDSECLALLTEAYYQLEALQSRNTDAPEVELVELIDEKEKWVVQAIGRMNASSEGLVRIPRDQAELIAKTLRQAGIALSTAKQEAPESQGGGKWSAVWIDAENKQPSIKFWAENQEQAERICDALSDSADVLSTPQQEAPVEAELVKSLRMLAEEIAGCMDNENAEAWAQDTLRKTISALSSRSGVWVSREDAEEIESLIGFVQSTWVENSGSQRVQARLDRTHGVIKQSLEQSNER